MLKIVIVNFNTQNLTDCTIRCVNKHTPNCHIYVFDNSDMQPFVNTHENVSVIDNTKQQILNFDEFLEKYPNRKKSPGYLGGKCISARHTITIDKCFDIIDDNFVLLDSDVIVKRDLNELVDESCIFVGDVSPQPLSVSIKRLLPFVCWINVKMCKEHGIRYFDENYMHGLANNKVNPMSDKYDTGGGFYIHAKAYNYKLINHKEYIVHYKGGSWDDKASRSAYRNGTPDEFINKYRMFWEPSNKKVIYTCICGPYDRLRDPQFVDSECDYICFTDQKFMTDKWIIRPIPDELKDLTSVKRQRAVKLLPHKYLPQYDLSVWVDANIDIKASVFKYVDEHKEPGKYLLVGEHPMRKCLYDEEKEVVKLKKDVPEITSKQMEKYRSLGMPEKFGLPQTCILIRWHNDPTCIKFDEAWWQEVKEHSHRDQLSFSYVMWSVDKDGIKFLDKSIFSCSTFFWWKIHTPPSIIKSTGISYLRRNNIESTRRIQRNLPGKSNPFI